MYLLCLQLRPFGLQFVFFTYGGGTVSIKDQSGKSLRNLRTSTGTLRKCLWGRKSPVRMILLFFQEIIWTKGAEKKIEKMPSSRYQYEDLVSQQIQFPDGVEP